MRTQPARAPFVNPLDVETEAIESDGQIWPVHAGIRLSLYEHAELPQAAKCASCGAPSDPARENANSGSLENSVTPALSFPYGTRIRIRAKLHPARNFRNPGAFDYEGYLRENGISLLGSAEAAGVERLSGFSGRRLALWRASSHASITTRIHQLWPPPKRRSWMPWSSAKSPFCAMPLAPSSSAPALII